MSQNYQSPVFSTEKSNHISPSKLRILLWDIDGTILQSNRPGSFKEYFAPALKKVYGAEGDFSNVNAAGSTDTQIAFQALEKEGFTVEKISSQIENFVEVLCDEMEKFTARYENLYELLPGVKEVLQKTSDDPCFVNALLTGNVSCGAEIKCQYVGVWKYFENSLNTYGDISHDRRELAIAAGKNFNRHYQCEFDAKQFIVIGDTPNDIITAKNFGAKVVAVETGRGIKRAALESEKPDFIASDLSDTPRILEILTTL